MSFELGDRPVEPDAWSTGTGSVAGTATVGTAAGTGAGTVAPHQRVAVAVAALAARGIAGTGFLAIPVARSVGARWLVVLVLVAIGGALIGLLATRGPRFRARAAPRRGRRPRQP